MENLWRSGARVMFVALALGSGGQGCKEVPPAGTPVGDATAGGEVVRFVDQEGRVAHLVRRPIDVPEAPNPGEFQVHLIDVGTGLAVLIRGADFTFLFDGGSNDDDRKGPNNRLLAYLSAAIGPSSIESCLPAGDKVKPRLDQAIPRIDFMMVSHPHRDHVVLLPDVLRCYEVGAVYDVGTINDAAFYQEFVHAVAEEPDVVYNTVVNPSSPPRLAIFGNVIDLRDVDWKTFEEGDKIDLGDDAGLTVVAADGTSHRNFNQNSLVVVVRLGNDLVLLTGDAESGPRPRIGQELTLAGTEAQLVREHGDAIDVDILQVGHHGSLTSSRPAFVAAVSPTWALIGAGPKEYNGHKRPDPEVEEMLEDVMRASGGHVLNTDRDDEHCPVKDRIGLDDTDHPGGCSNYVLFLGP